jgi:hypothetical protein
LKNIDKQDKILTIVKITKTDIIKNGLWLTLLPLLFSLSLMSFLPTALTPAQFNQGIPDLLVNIESIGRILVFAMPVFFSIGIFTTTQKWGLAFYVAGVILYCLSYGTQNFFPNSDWSNSTLGFAASAYTNVFWMIGLGLLGEKFYFIERLRYRPIFYIVPAVIFVISHTTHAVIYHQRSF